jgi:DNA-directed RNA polymerase specialized sigma24 family protein
MPELADEDTPSVLVERQEERNQLWQTAQRKLPRNQFQALWLRYAEEMDLDQIATVLGKTKTGVKVLLFRARQTLGLALEREQAKVAEKTAQALRPSARAAAPARIPMEKLSLT